MSLAIKSYKLYLFDLDGTLLDSDQMLIETFHYLYKKFKPKDFVIDEEKIITFSGPQIKDTLKKEFPELDQQMILEEWRKESKKNYPIYTKLFPGAYALLSTLVENRIPTAIITNKHRDAYVGAIPMFGLDKLNIFSICADESGRLKPYPDGIYKCMEHFGIKDKKDVIYIGDSIYDYETSQNAGVDFGLVSWTPRKLPKNCRISVKIDKFEDLLRN